jgi:hypothetical protein
MARMTAMRSVLVGIVLLSAAPALSGDPSSSEETLSRTIVTGTLIRLDLTGMTGLVQTDLGKPIFFEVTKPQLFEHLSVGARVTVELDGYGRANKVIDASVTEFLEIPPEEQDAEVHSVT